MIGVGASVAMSHAAPTSCIHVPTFDMTVAIQRLRKTGPRNGLQGDVVVWPGTIRCSGEIEDEHFRIVLRDYA
jgi:hypothetical protein